MRTTLVVLALLLLAPLAAAQTAGGGGSAGGDGNVCASASTADAADRDEDGLPDRWECRYFGHLKQDGKGDPDEDGRENRDEFKDGTDPTKADAKPDDGDEPDDRDEPEENETDEPEGNKTDNSGPGGPGSLRQTCKDADDRRACVEAYCAEHDDSECRALVAKACSRGELRCAALIEPCTRIAFDDVDDDRLKTVCKQLRKVDDIRVDSKHVDFDVDREGRALIDYAVGGTVLFAAIEYGEEAEDFKVKQDGSRIRFQTDDSRLEIHDNPTANFWYRSEDDDASLRLVLAPGTRVHEAPNGLNLQLNGYVYRLAGHDLVQDGESIVLTGDARFFRTGVQAGALDQDIVEEAIANGNLGASVAVDDTSEVTAYDDVDVNVSKPDKITLDEPLRVTVNATLDSGRTIVIDLDRDELAGPELVLSYYDVHEDGSETEVVFRMADSLEDVMDANNDGGQPEYWIVEDEDGVHVMASVPHWSTHIIQVAADFLTQPSVLIGIGAGILGVALGGAGMFWPRRREDF